MKKNNIYKKFFVIAIIVAGLLSPFASSFPDGLEKSIEEVGVRIEEEASLIPSILPDYNLELLNNDFLGTAVSGIIGVVVTYFVVFLLTKIMIKKRHI